MSTTATRSSRAARSSARQTTAPGLIVPDALYTADEARQRLRIGAWAWRQWRRDGLEVLRLSGRSFVRGATLIAFVEQHGRDGGQS